jgi:hypothetical protein
MHGSKCHRVDIQREVKNSANNRSSVRQNGLAKRRGSWSLAREPEKKR